MGKKMINIFYKDQTVTCMIPVGCTMFGNPGVDRPICYECGNNYECKTFATRKMDGQKAWWEYVFR